MRSLDYFNFGCDFVAFVPETFGTLLFFAG
jgi:hypothetical protein